MQCTILYYIRLATLYCFFLTRRWRKMSRVTTSNTRLNYTRLKKKQFIYGNFKIVYLNYNLFSLLKNIVFHTQTHTYTHTCTIDDTIVDIYKLQRCRRFDTIYTYNIRIKVCNLQTISISNKIYLVVDVEILGGCFFF